MQVNIDPSIRTHPMASHLVEEAMRVLAEVARDSQFEDKVTVSWSLRPSPSQGLLVEIDDGQARMNTGYKYESLSDARDLESRMLRLWGDYLGIRSRVRYDFNDSNEDPSISLEGDEALNQIIDTAAEFTEREGHEPTELKLPTRFAFALMKLGPSFWGGFYEKIRETGLRAFTGQRLLGMQVELISGATAHLEVKDTRTSRADSLTEATIIG